MHHLGVEEEVTSSGDEQGDRHGGDDEDDLKDRRLDWELRDSERGLGGHGILAS